ncbi:uncharacterized protein EV154DRAFT_524724, partial [Mucor mucedo]|uniref:uncharacterized protein n=1 Tax=Mucor mucedo TaxID=29922 RepID=UPI00221F2C34
MCKVLNDEETSHFCLGPSSPRSCWFDLPRSYQMIITISLFYSFFYQIMKKKKGAFQVGKKNILVRVNLITVCVLVTIKFSLLRFLFF